MLALVTFVPASSGGTNQPLSGPLSLASSGGFLSKSPTTPYTPTVDTSQRRRIEGRRSKPETLTPPVREFLDGLAELIAEDILRKQQGVPGVAPEEHPVKPGEQSA